MSKPEDMKSRVDLEYHYGDSQNKIHACNRNIPADGWKVCVLVCYIKIENR